MDRISMIRDFTLAKGPSGFEDEVLAVARRYAPEGVSPVLYSLVFNGSYLSAELVICCLILKVLPVKRLMDNIVK